jgi:hypothetical protein
MLFDGGKVSTTREKRERREDVHLNILDHARLSSNRRPVRRRGLRERDVDRLVVLEFIELAAYTSPARQYRTKKENRREDALSVLAMNWKTRPWCEAGDIMREWRRPSEERVTSMAN